jgi:hypothetical protein
MLTLTKKDLPQGKSYLHIENIEVIRLAQLQVVDNKYFKRLTKSENINGNEVFLLISIV